jgi:hypothetical protein
VATALYRRRHVRSLDAWARISKPICGGIERAIDDVSNAIGSLNR